VDQALRIDLQTVVLRNGSQALQRRVWKFIGHSAYQFDASLLRRIRGYIVVGRNCCGTALDLPFCFSFVANSAQKKSKTGQGLALLLTRRDRQGPAAWDYLPPVLK
jgi:hypothetical protein